MTVNPKNGIVFLAHDNRSGSTFLAGLLDNFPDIGVTTESPLLSYLLKGEKNYETASGLTVLLDRLYSEDKFKSWGIPRSTLEQSLLKRLPRTRQDIFYLILNAYFDIHKPNSTLWVYKGVNPYYVIEAKRFLPEAKFLFIYRDGRAVFSSKRRSIDTSGHMMEKNPLRAARKWCTYIQLAKLTCGQGHGLMVKYEDLVCWPEEQLRKIFRFFIGSDLSSTQVSLVALDYKKKIPRSQLHLHQNVGNTPLKSRIEAWKAELPLAERYIYENVAHSTLKSLGYQLTEFDEKLLAEIRKDIRRLRFKIVYYNLEHLFRTVKFYVSKPRDLLFRIRLKLENLQILIANHKH